MTFEGLPTTIGSKREQWVHGQLLDLQTHYQSTIPKDTERAIPGNR